MRYLKPTLSLIVAVTLIEDYTLTIVVSALSGGDQLLSLVPQFYQYWYLHFAIGALLALGTCTSPSEVAANRQPLVSRCWASLRCSPHHGDWFCLSLT